MSWEIGKEEGKHTDRQAEDKDIAISCITTNNGIGVRKSGVGRANYNALIINLAHLKEGRRQRGSPQ